MSMLRKSAPLPFRTWNSQSENCHPRPAPATLPHGLENEQTPLRKSYTLEGRWRVDPEILGSGSWAEVQSGYDLKENVKIAVKIIDRLKLKERDRTLVAREIRVMQSLHHPNIARMLGHLEQGSKIYIFMEYFGGGDLLSLAIRDPRLVQSKARRFFQQIIAGVEYLHRRGIVHRDLKLENIILNESHTHVVITDFGLCDFMSSEPFDVYCGSPAYAAPELVTRTPYHGEPVDMWALGVLLYTLLCGSYPFDAEDIGTLYSRIVKASPRLPKSVSSKAVPIIEGLLRKNPEQRLKLTDVKDSAWMRGSFVGAIRTAARSISRAVEQPAHVRTMST